MLRRVKKNVPLCVPTALWRPYHGSVGLKMALPWLSVGVLVCTRYMTNAPNTVTNNNSFFVHYQVWTFVGGPSLHPAGFGSALIQSASVWPHETLCFLYAWAAPRGWRENVARTERKEHQKKILGLSREVGSQESERKEQKRKPTQHPIWGGTGTQIHSENEPATWWFSGVGAFSSRARTFLARQGCARQRVCFCSLTSLSK